MTKAIEIGAMILGSASLLLVSFLGFAVMSGVPLHEVAVIGGLFAAPPVPAEKDVTLDVTDPMAPKGEPMGPTKPAQDVVASTMGLMSAYGLPSPYTQSELQELADELKGRAARLEARGELLDDREEALGQLESGYEQKLVGLKDMQDRLDSFQRELLQREREVAREEEAESLSEERKYAEIARVLEGFKDDRREKLIAQYEPEEAALILLALPEKIRTKTLSGLSESVTPEQGRAYIEAFSAAAENVSR